MGSSTAARHAARNRVPAALFALACWSTSSAYAIEIVAIEEHWELSVGEPDAASSSPQVSMVMSPRADLADEYFVFTLNHRSAPHWAAGGMQVQRYNGEELVESRVGVQESPLAESNETVRWVQRTSVKDGVLKFEVDAGESESWGEFGGEGRLRLSTETTLTNLNGYRPAISLEESGVSFAGNRVRSLVLKKLRWTDSSGETYELEAPIDVDADLDP